MYCVLPEAALLVLADALAWPYRSIIGIIYTVVQPYRYSCTIALV
jgi:hypothetical protein